MLTTNWSEPIQYDSQARYELPFTLSQLQLVQAIADTGNFTKAADQLFISQPTASQRIHQLEQDLGVILFHRSSQKIQTTSAGETLLNYSRRILSLCLEAKRALVGHKHLESGNLVIGASPSLGTYLLPSLIGHYRQLHPSVPVQLQIKSTPQICQRVVDGQIDMALVEGDIPTKFQQSIHVKAESDDEIVLVLPASHPYIRRKSIKPQELYKLNFIVLDPQHRTHQVIDQELVNGKIDISRLQVEMSFGSLEAIKNAVQSGLGAAFVPLLSIQKELELGLLRQVDIKDVSIRQKVSIIASAKHYRSQSADNFQQQVIDPYLLEIWGRDSLASYRSLMALDRGKYWRGMNTS